MTSREKKRKYIFDKYSTNLILLKKNGIVDIQLSYDKTYICPICLNQFSEESLDQSVKNPLTLEDAPPKSLGGKANILTCKECNNTCGHEIDKHLTERIIEIDNHKFTVNSEFSAQFEIDGKLVQGRIIIDSNGIMKAYHIDKNNNPIKLKDYLKTINKDKVVNIHIDKKKVNPINMQLALLKTGLLLVFEKYGYSFILDESYNRLREQLQNPLKIIYPLEFWMKVPWPKEIYGVPFIIEKGIESVCPIFPLKTKSSEYVFATIIPLTNKPIEDLILELKKRFTKQSEFPVSFDPMNSDVDYLSDIKAINKMLNWIKQIH